MQRLVAVDLAGAEKLVKVAAEASGALADASVHVLADLLHRSPEALGALRSCCCKIVTTGPTGAPLEQTMDGLQLAVFMHRSQAGTVVSRAWAVALLGQLAMCATVEEEEVEVEASKPKLPPEQLRAVYGDDPDFDPEDFIMQTEIREVVWPVRQVLLEQGVLDSMTDVLFDVSTALLAADPPAGSESAAAAAPSRRTARASRITEVRAPVLGAFVPEQCVACLW